MDFIYLFDLLNFGENGQVIATKSYNINQARENFVYLLSKYNQKLLKIQKKPTPAFFKEELAGVLESVRLGQEQQFEDAKKVVVGQCEDYLKEIFEKARTDEEAILILNRLLAKKDRTFFGDKLSNKIENAVNNKQITYTLTSCANDYFNKATKIQADGGENRKDLFSYVINYNTLSTMAVLVEKGTLRKEDLVEKDDLFQTEYQTTFANQFVAARVSGGASAQI